MNLQNVLPWYSSQELHEQNQETVFLCTSSLIKIHVIIPSENPRGSRRGEVREGEGGVWILLLFVEGIKWYLYLIFFPQQSTLKEDHYQRQKMANLYHSLSIKSSVKALALSSGVGNNRTHPLLRAPWAAACTVLSTPLLLASDTTCCFNDCSSLLPTPSPKSSASTFPVMAAWSWVQNKGREDQKLKFLESRYDVRWTVNE